MYESGEAMDCLWQESEEAADRHGDDAGRSGGRTWCKPSVYLQDFKRRPQWIKVSCGYRKDFEITGLEGKAEEISYDLLFF